MKIGNGNMTCENCGSSYLEVDLTGNIMTNTCRECNHVSVKTCDKSAKLFLADEELTPPTPDTLTR